MTLCELSGGCDWFLFTLWDGCCWVPARHCKRGRCQMEQFHDGTHWIGRNLRLHRAVAKGGK